MIKTPLMNVLTTSIQRAARDLVRDFGEVGNLQVSRKGTGDFVSQADKRSEEVLIENLSKARPDFHFITEESGAIQAKQAGGDTTWIIDPLDGTTNFLHGMPHFCITVAVKKEDDIIACATYDPVRDEMFVAEKGQGAFLNNRRMRVSVRTALDEGLIAIGHIPQTKREGLCSKGISLRCMGSAALDLAYAAAGRLDGVCYQRLKTWDVAAGVLLVQEAGGYITDLETRLPATWQSQNIVAGSPHFHNLLLKDSEANA